MDSVHRHKRHLSEAKTDANASLGEKWREIYSRADEIFRSASVQGDARAALTALQQQASALESSTRLRSEKVGFEALSLPEKIQYVRANGDLYRGLFDEILRETDAYYAANHLMPCPNCNFGRVKQHPKEDGQLSDNLQ